MRYCRVDSVDRSGKSEMRFIGEHNTGDDNDSNDRTLFDSELAVKSES